MRIEDIAREAGVSTATVSRVLNTPERVKESTRERVLSVVDRHEYVLDPFARGLMKQRSMSVGVIIISISNSYYMEITEAIQRRLRDAGYMMLLAASDDSAELERKYLLEFASRRTDGIIVLDASNENFANGLFKREAAKRQVVLVHSNPAISDSGLGQVFVDQRLGMRKAMDHLGSLGHRRVAFLRGRSGYSYDLKQEAWAAWLRERRLPAPDELVLRLEDANTEEAIPQAEAAVSAMIRAGSLPSAIFACNDLMASGAVNAVTKAGLRIPGDVSIVGHDDTILALSGPVHLTSVSLKMREVGLQAAELLIAALGDGERKPRSLRVEPELIVRDSTGPIPGSRRGRATGRR